MNFNLGKFPLLPRKKRADKSHYGRALIVAGSQGMTGAALLAVRSAIMSGAGLTTLGAPQSLLPIFAKSLPECMVLALPQNKDKSLSFSAYKKIIEGIIKKRINGILIGPGLSQNWQTSKLVRKLVTNIKVSVVLDADGLNSFSAKGGKGYLKALQKHRSPLILTPHKREFERLFEMPWPSRQSARITLAKKLSKFYDVVLALKGERSLVVFRDKCYVNRTGNPGLAKGGSGDVLAGIVTAFICQGLTPFLAACWAVYFHGKSADLAVKRTGELSLTASDVIHFLPKAFGVK